VIVLAEPAGSTLAAKKRRQVAPLVKATSTPKNRVWGFADSPSGRPVADLHLNQENATGSVQFTYETASGRAYFLTRDPLGFIAGPNMYCYVHQNPWTHFDPEGLDDNKPAQQTTPSPKPTTSEGSATTKPPPLIPNAPATKATAQSNTNEKSKGAEAPISPEAQLDVPSLSLGMKSPKDQALNAAADFDRAAAASSPAGSAKSTKEDHSSWVEAISTELGFAGIAAGAADLSHSKFGSNGRFYFNEATRGNQYFKIAFDLGEAGRKFGVPGAILGVGLDAGRFLHDPKDMSAGHVAANAVMARVGFMGLPGFVVASTYFLMDSFYPHAAGQSGVVAYGGDFARAVRTGSTTVNPPSTTPASGALNMDSSGHISR
jgi:hypothetical protein